MTTTRNLTLLSLLAVFLSLTINIFRPSPFPHPNMSTPQPGDALIPSPEMLYTHAIAIHASPRTIFPWILQLGKARGGWYLPASWERFLPKSMHASRSINPAWTGLKVGDIVKDYGFDEKEDVFEVAEIVDGGQDGRRALVYKSERYGTVFTWAIVVDDLGDAGREGWSEVTLRFRGRIQRTGWQRKVLVWGGGWMDWATTWPMLRGLKERCEREHGD
jgi:hypothetical protein